MRRVLLLAATTSLLACSAAPRASDTDDGAAIRSDAGEVSSEDGGAGEPPPVASPDAGSSSFDAGSVTIAPPDAGSVAALVDPAGTGPHAFTRQSGQLTRSGRVTPWTALVPDRTPAPLVVFIPGYQLDSSRYDALLAHVASHGFLAIRCDPPDPLFGVSHVEMAKDVRAVLDLALSPTGPLAGKTDPAQVGVFGHSLGGKVATMVAASDPRVKALLGLDPVNGGLPFVGYTNDLPDIVPDDLSPLTIPLGFMGETTNATAGTGGQACAPADQNFTTFADAATRSPWVASWDVFGADHMDFVEDTSGCGFVCSACPDGSAVDAEVHATTRTLAAAFFRRHLLGEAAMDAFLVGDRLPAGLGLQHRP